MHTGPVWGPGSQSQRPRSCELRLPSHALCCPESDGRQQCVLACHLGELMRTRALVPPSGTGGRVAGTDTAAGGAQARTQLSRVCSERPVPGPAVSWGLG